MLVITITVTDVRRSRSASDTNSESIGTTIDKSVVLRGPDKEAFIKLASQMFDAAVVAMPSVVSSESAVT